MDNKTLKELIAMCKEYNIKGYSNKNKANIINLLQSSETKSSETKSSETNTILQSYDVLSLSSSSSSSSSMLKMIDLFAGTGAFTYAFEKTGKVECVFSNDMVEWSKKIYDIKNDTDLNNYLLDFIY